MSGGHSQQKYTHFTQKQRLAPSPPFRHHKKKSTISLILQVTWGVRVFFTQFYLRYRSPSWEYFGKSRRPSWFDRFWSSLWPLERLKNLQVSCIVGLDVKPKLFAKQKGVKHISTSKWENHVGTRWFFWRGWDPPRVFFQSFESFVLRVWDWIMELRWFTGVCNLHMFQSCLWEVLPHTPNKLSEERAEH